MESNSRPFGSMPPASMAGMPMGSMPPPMGMPPSSTMGPMGAPGYGPPMSAQSIGPSYPNAGQGQPFGSAASVPKAMGSMTQLPPPGPYGAPPQTMGPSAGMMPPGSAQMMGQAPMSMPPQYMPPMSCKGGPPLSMEGQYMPNVSRPQMTGVGNPPVVAGNIQYGPSYRMQYQKRSSADKTAVKYTGFLPLEGVYEEDTCRIG
mmetsp:Transcript_110666/g.313002  ORF Transcript_110666/g.313002 Transcript_110666/m.313002 type:complete len:203 (+) Transcript_110666:98-706(+)